MYLYDYHMHSQNSIDGKSKISELCIAALDSGLNEIAVTDHFEPTRTDPSNLSYNVQTYFFEILKVKALFGDRINIKAAVEIGQPHLFTEITENLIESNPYDYVLASAHKMDGEVDFGEVTYNNDNISYYCDKYLTELKAVAEWNKFDCMSHLDLIKRYAANFDIEVNIFDYKDRLTEILKIIIENGKGIEVNTSGLRQSSGECLPNLDIVSLYKELGGEIITVGSDAHTSKDVGKGVKEGLELIKAAGFNYVATYSERKPIMVKINDKQQTYYVKHRTA